MAGQRAVAMVELVYGEQIPWFFIVVNDGEFIYIMVNHGNVYGYIWIYLDIYIYIHVWKKKIYIYIIHM